MFSFNRGMVMKQTSRATIRPGAGAEPYLKQTPTVVNEHRPRAMGESDLRSLLPIQTSVDDGDALAGTSEESEDGYAAFRAQQNASMMNRATTQLQPKKSGERRYKKLFRMAEEQRLAEKAQREAATAEMFEALPDGDSGMSADEVFALTTQRRNAATTGLMEAQGRRAFASLAGTDAAMSTTEADTLTDQRRNAATTGLMEAQGRRAFDNLPANDAAMSTTEADTLTDQRRNAATTGLMEAQGRRAFDNLPANDAAFSNEEREDIKAQARRNAAAGRESDVGTDSVEIGSEELEDVRDEGAIGLSTGVEARNPAMPAGILTGGRKRGGIRWAGDDADPNAAPERIKHFEYTDPSVQVAQEEEFTGPALRNGDGNPAAYAASLSDDEASANARQRKYQLMDMVTSMPRAETQDNVYAQDIASPDLLQYGKTKLSNEESDEFWEESVQARRKQNQRLGKRGYSTEDRKRVARTGNGGSGFMNSLIGALGLGKLFGTSRDRTFDAAPNVRPRTKPRSWFQRLFGTSRRVGRADG